MPPKKSKNDLLVASLAREYTEDALKTLANIMLNGEKETDKRGAADSLLDRGWGKPAQAHTDADGDKLPTPHYNIYIEGVERK